MPELPEVETFVRQLRKPLIGRKICSAKVSWKNMIVRPGLSRFIDQVRGGKIVSINRRAKYLVFELEYPSGPKRWLVMHLRMSGVLEVHPSMYPADPYDRIVFSLDDDHELRFNDTRKFGKLHLVTDLDEVFKDIGPEPLDPDFQSDQFARRLSEYSGQMKPLLLNQKFIAGLGNIYVDEVLWRAAIHPRRKAISLTQEEKILLFRSIRSVLSKAIKWRGTDFGDEVVPGGQYKPKVYGRTGDKCYRCKCKIERITVGQRGTHFCPKCQPLTTGRSRRSHKNGQVSLRR